MSNTSRRTSLTYPNGRVVNLGYGSSDSIDDLFSLVKSAAISGESGNKVEILGDRLIEILGDRLII